MFLAAFKIQSILALWMFKSADIIHGLFACDFANSLKIFGITIIIIFCLSLEIFHRQKLSGFLYIWHILILKSWLSKYLLVLQVFYKLHYTLRCTILSFPVRNEYILGLTHWISERLLSLINRISVLLRNIFGMWHRHYRRLGWKSHRKKILYHLTTALKT
jgi:hypothetical protein